MHRRKLKTMKDWEREANGNCQYSWYDYAKPGDLVDESVFIYFMDVTTPRIYRDGYLQVGAPYSRVMDDEMGTAVSYTHLTLPTIRHIPVLRKLLCRRNKTYRITGGQKE